MKIIIEDTLKLNQELKFLMRENVDLVSRFWLQKLFKDIMERSNEIQALYSYWEFRNKGKTLDEFLTANNELKALAMDVGDYVFVKASFTPLPINNYPVFNRIFTKI